MRSKTWTWPPRPRSQLQRRQMSLIHVKLAYGVITIRTIRETLIYHHHANFTTSELVLSSWIKYVTGRWDVWQISNEDSLTTTTLAVWLLVLCLIIDIYILFYFILNTAIWLRTRKLLGPSDDADQQATWLSGQEAGYRSWPASHTEPCGAEC